MDHPGFFENAGPFRLEEIASATGASLTEEAGPSLEIHDIRTLNSARATDLSFFDNRKYFNDFVGSNAGACLVDEKSLGQAPQIGAYLLTSDTYRSFAKAVALFYPDTLNGIGAGAGTNDGPAIHPEAQIEEGVTIEPGVVVGPEAQIGAGTLISAGAVIGRRVAIGRDCRIGPNVSITHCLLGNRVVIHAGAAIGQDGFGFAMGPLGHLKVPQIGRVIIQDDVEIGANTTIDRGAMSDTVVGEGSKIDNLVQIAHNVQIGRHCVIVSQTGIAGSAVLEDFVVLGGQSAIAGHITVAAGTQVAASGGVTKSIGPGIFSGAPAVPIQQWRREVAAVRRLANPKKT